VNTVTIIMVGASLVTLGLLFSCTKRARLARDLDASSALAVAMGVAATLPIAVVAIAGGIARRPDAVGQLTAFFPGWYGTADSLAKLLLMVFAAALLVGRLLSGRVIVHAAGLAALGLWMLAQLASLRQGAGAPANGSFVLLVCLAAATVLPRGRGACLGAGIFGLSLAIVSCLLAIFRHNVAFIVPCTGACSGLGFTGILPNENLLGVSLAAAVPFAYLGFRGRARIWFVIYLAGMASATGSRTAIGASVITLVALLVIRPALDAPLPGLGRKVMSWSLLGGAVAASLFVILHHWQPSDLTTRPRLWAVASDYIHHSPWFGYGPTRWGGLYETSQIPQAAQRSAHNLWLDVLFVSGAVGAVFFVAILIGALASAGRARTGVIVTLATIFMLGTTEGSWAIGTFDFMSFSLIALMLTGPACSSDALTSAVTAKNHDPLPMALPQMSPPRVL
jgi:O-antigen ligase